MKFFLMLVSAALLSGQLIAAETVQSPAFSEKLGTAKTEVSKTLQDSKSKGTEQKNEISKQASSVKSDAAVTANKNIDAVKSKATAETAVSAATNPAAVKEDAKAIANNAKTDAKTQYNAAKTSSKETAQSVTTDAKNTKNALSKTTKDLLK